MLLRFGVANHRSLQTYQELRLTVSNAKATRHTYAVPTADVHLVLVSAIYGANASGKSNVLDALGFLRSAIVNSHKTQPGSSLGRDPFQLSETSKHEPSLFDCDFILDSVRFHYGFEITDERVNEEWLYAYPTGRRQVWFHRSGSSQSDYRFGKSLMGANATIARLTRENSLFLSVAAQNNHQQLMEIFRYFSSKWTVHFGGDVADAVTGAFLVKDGEGTADRIVDLLKIADVGIIGATTESTKIDQRVRNVMSSLETALKTHFKDFDLGIDEAPDDIRTLKLGHAAQGGECVFLPFESESRGTRRLMRLAGLMLDALSKGEVLIVDEFDVNLHPMLAAKLISVFQSPETNKLGAQLIFTTHDITLLSSGELGREEVWFTEKDGGGATHLYPLSDVRLRKDDNIGKGYIRGRFGAIPFLQNWSEQSVWNDDSDSD